jgi:hypothetical protein
VKYLVASATPTTVEVFDHHKPKQKNGGLPTITFSLDNRDGSFKTGDRVSITIRKEEQ